MGELVFAPLLCAGLGTILLPAKTKRVELHSREWATMEAWNNPTQ
jgi:hypothetical protein